MLSRTHVLFKTVYSIKNKCTVKDSLMHAKPGLTKT